MPTVHLCCITLTDFIEQIIKKYLFECMCKCNRIVINVINRNWFFCKWWYSYKDTLWKIFWKRAVFRYNFVMLCVIQIKNKQKYQEDHFLWRSKLICTYADRLLVNKLPFKASFLKFINLLKKLIWRGVSWNPATSRMDKKSRISRQQSTAEGRQLLSVRALS